MAVIVQSFHEFAEIVEKSRRRKLRRLQNIFNLLRTRLEFEVGKIFFTVLAHIGINNRLPLSIIAELARNFFAGKKFVVVVNRLEHLTGGISYRRVIDDSRRFAADDANVSCARADVDANRALSKITRLAVKFVEVIRGGFTFRPKVRRIVDGFAANLLEGNFLRLRKCRRVGEIPLHIVRATCNSFSSRLQANLFDVSRSFATLTVIVLPLQIGVNVRGKLLKHARIFRTQKKNMPVNQRLNLRQLADVEQMKNAQK